MKIAPLISNLKLLLLMRREDPIISSIDRFLEGAKFNYPVTI